MFIGRTRELADMNRSYETGKFQFLVLYGRRRIGKTTLISEFIKDKPTLFFSAQDSNTAYNLTQLSNQIFQFFNVSAGPRFPDWASLFEYAAQQIKEKRMVLVLDEFPYLAQRDPSILSALQHAIDHQFKDSSLYLILCGSTMSFMENEILGTKSPLFGRRTLQIHLKPFLYDAVARFAPQYTASDQAILYGLVGGTPHYLNMIDPSIPLEENIRSLFLSSSAYLYDEPLLLLKQELREPAVYNTILAALANGASRRNDITTQCGEPTDKVGKYLSVLMALGLVVRTTPFGEKVTVRNSIYALKDPLFRFWYRFIFPYRGLIELGQRDPVLKEKILPFLPQYMGPIFEEICLDFVRLRNGSDRLQHQFFLEFGKWWGNDPLEKAQAEVDLVALSEGKVLLGECKWSETAFPLSACEKLIRRRLLIHSGQNREPIYAMFSKTGFDRTLVKRAAENSSILLFSLDEIFGS